MKKTLTLSVLALAASLGTSAAMAQTLNVVCSNEQAWCDLMAQNFEIETGIDVAVVRKSTGETLAQIRAEAGNPKVDVWWGGTGDPHLIAAAEDLTQPSGVDVSGQLGWSQNMTEMSGGKAVGVHVGLLGVIYNTEVLAEKGLEPPACWRDLAKPEYLGEIQVANPNSSGTAYTELATLVQLFGEDEGFKLLAEIGRNVNQYTKSGSAPGKATARGENTIAIGFMHDMVNLKKQGFPVEIVAPCEGTGYEVGSMSIVEGAPNPDEARVFYDWVLTPEAQNLMPEAGSYQIPSNKAATISDKVPDLSQIKLIDYDFAEYGSSERRKGLLARWDAEIGGRAAE